MSNLLLTLILGALVGIIVGINELYKAIKSKDTSSEATPYCVALSGVDSRVLEDILHAIDAVQTEISILGDKLGPPKSPLDEF